ncbi:hypothetical protein [Miltoncostaea oceani]|uniref:hypothetical protein n=1 Tax=Miltoncostaea oceani TaxID=2843216 RepID=UPI001C3C476D|nr:hypothetical protein [Miltoncostaea oceani]
MSIATSPEGSTRAVRAAIAQASFEVSARIDKQLRRALDDLPTEPPLPGTAGRLGNESELPRDLIAMSLWAIAIDDDRTAHELLDRAADHITAHLDWLGTQPRLISGSDRDEMASLASWLLAKVQRMRADRTALHAEAKELEVRAKGFAEEQLTSTAAAPTFAEAAHAGDLALMRETALVMAEAVSPERLAEVDGVSDEQWERFSLQIRARGARVPAHSAAWIRDRNDARLLDDLLACDERTIQLMRLDDYSGFEREVIEARLDSRLPTLHHLVRNRVSPASDAEIARFVGSVRHYLTVAQAAGAAEAGRLRLAVPQQELERVETLVADGQGRITRRLIEAYRYGRRTRADLTYELTSSAIVDGVPVSVTFAVPLGATHQRTAASRLVRARATAERMNLPQPDPGLWGEEGLVEGDPDDSIPAIPELGSIADFFGPEPVCDHPQMVWVGVDHPRRHLRCAQCQRTLAEVKNFQVGDTIPLRQRNARRFLGHEQSLAILRGDEPPTLEGLLAAPTVDPDAVEASCASYPQGPSQGQTP